MTNNYASTTAWHYTDPNSGQVPDLHHGIFYKSIGGGKSLSSLLFGSTFDAWLNLIKSCTLCHQVSPTSLVRAIAMEYVLNGVSNAIQTLGLD